MSDEGWGSCFYHQRKPRHRVWIFLLGTFEIRLCDDCVHDLHDVACDVTRRVVS